MLNLSRYMSLFVAAAKQALFGDESGHRSRPGSYISAELSCLLSEYNVGTGVSV